MSTLRIATRRSALATRQAALVGESIASSSTWTVELVPIQTYGDATGAALSQIGGSGVFVGALREALLRGEVDVAVHSLKDLPTTDPEGVVLAAVPTREDPRDVLVARKGATLAELPVGARVGTGSPRRAAQLHALGLGLDVVPVRGNVDTRLRLVSEGALDAVVLARAGLARLGRLGEVSETLDPLQMLPAAGQGALAVECRVDDPATHGLLQRLDDTATRASVTAERALLRDLEAGCTAPVGAYGEVAEGEHEQEIYLRAVVTSVDGAAAIRLSATGALADAEGIGRRLAAELLREGAGDLMGERVP